MGIKKNPREGGFVWLSLDFCLAEVLVCHGTATPYRGFFIIAETGNRKRGVECLRGEDPGRNILSPETPRRVSRALIEADGSFGCPFAMAKH